MPFEEFNADLLHGLGSVEKPLYHAKLDMSQVHVLILTGDYTHLQHSDAHKPSSMENNGEG